MTITLNALQKQRRDTASNWTSNNTVLLAGEFGYETDTGKLKIGDGSTAWQSLDYLPIPDTNRLLTGNLTVGGNFTVNGTSTTIDTTTLTVEDKNIEIGKVSTPSDTTADGGGITLKGATDKTINWVDSTDSWTFSEHLDLASGKVLKSAGTQFLSSTQFTGNSATATALATARTIGGVSFDGTANIDLSEVIQDTVGTMFSSNTETGITVTYQDADGTIDLVVGTLNQDTTGKAATATALETARTIHGVSFDGTGNIDLTEVIQDTVGAMFSSNTETDIAVTYQDGDGTIDLVVSDISGNAATATALETARTIAGVSFDGTANISIASTNLSDTSSIVLLTSSQTLTNKTLTSPVINTGISGTAVLDEDDMSSNSATQIATQQSIKAFVEAVESRTRAFAIAIGAGL